MPTVFDKLNLKDHREIVVLNAPESFEAALAALNGVKVVRTVPRAASVGFALVFAITQAEVDKAAQALTAAAVDDATLWFAYPKQSSKRYTCGFNRDTGWAALGAAGYEAVRQVAIDEDWSALRFRKVEFIQSLKRDASRAISTTGKQRTTKI
jgi:hypothetical protein